MVERRPVMHPQISVWLLPEEADAAPVVRLMSALRDLLGGPRFPPHVTLLGAGAHADAHAIARAIGAPLAIELVGVDFGDTVHQSLYARVRMTDALDRARRATAAATGARLVSPWMPHVSLHYGLLDQASRAAASRVVASATFPVVLRVTRVAAWSTGGAVEGWRALSDAALPA